MITARLIRSSLRARLNRTGEGRDVVDSRHYNVVRGSAVVHLDLDGAAR